MATASAGSQFGTCVSHWINYVMQWYIYRAQMVRLEPHVEFRVAYILCRHVRLSIYLSI